MRRAIAVLGLAAMLWGLLVAPASAHSVDQSYVYLEVFDDTIEGRVEYPVGDLSEVLGFQIPADADGATAAIEPNLEQLHDYSQDHLAMQVGGTDAEIVFRDFEILEEGSLVYVIVPFAIEGTFDPMPREFVVDYDGIIREIPERSALLLIATDWRSGTFNNVEDHLVAYDANTTSQEIDLGETSVWRGIGGVIALGIEHIQIGIDHILFIIALLLPAVLVFTLSKGWEPSPSFGASLWRVVKIATSFTIAHTITLTLGGLGAIDISPDVVEPVIAISIGLAALHNLRPIFFNKEWILAFVFGLFHGFGFAGLLANLGLDRSNRVVSLLGFNLGIEIGQVAIILLVFPALFLLRRTRIYKPLMYAGSVGLIVVAVAWFTERTVGIETGLTIWIEEAFQWPRPLYGVALLTLLAWGWWAFEKSRGRLLDLPDEDLGEESPAVGAAARDG